MKIITERKVNTSAIKTGVISLHTFLIIHIES